MDSLYLIYALIDPRNGQRFYVGQSSIGLRRPAQHVKVAGREKTAKAAHLRELLAAGMSPVVEVLQRITDPDEAMPAPLHCWTGRDATALDAAEMWWIKHGRDHGWPLTNSTHGGDGVRGLPRTAEHNEKISVSHIGNQYAKGYRATPEHRAKLSAAKKGPIRTAEHAAKIGAANLGKPKHTEEHKAQLRIRMSGAGNPNYGRKASPEMKAKLSAAHIGVQAGPKNPNYGKKMSDEQKAKISATKRARSNQT